MEKFLREQMPDKKWDDFISKLLASTTRRPYIWEPTQDHSSIFEHQSTSADMNRLTVCLLIIVCALLVIAIKLCCKKCKAERENSHFPERQLREVVNDRTNNLPVIPVLSGRRNQSFVLPETHRLNVEQRPVGADLPPDYLTVVSGKDSKYATKNQFPEVVPKKLMDVPPPQYGTLPPFK